LRLSFATLRLDTWGALFPQLFRTKVATDAISSSFNFHANAGIAGALGFAGVGTERLPSRMIRNVVVGSCA
jgi:hypothetical protein